MYLDKQAFNIFIKASQASPNNLRSAVSPQAVNYSLLLTLSNIADFPRIHTHIENGC